MMERKPQLRRNVAVAYVLSDQTSLGAIEEVLHRLQAKSFLSRWQTYSVEKAPDLFPDADIIVLLISPDFVASHYFQAQATLLKKHEVFEVCCIPVMAKYTVWYHLPFAKLPLLPVDYEHGAKPIADWNPINRTYALKDLQEGLLTIIEAFEQQQIAQMDAFLQDALDALTQPLPPLLRERLLQWLPERIFAICERLEYFIPEKMIPLFERLAEETYNDQPNLSLRCRERASMLQQQQEKEG